MRRGRGGGVGAATGAAALAAAALVGCEPVVGNDCTGLTEYEAVPASVEVEQGEAFLPRVVERSCDSHRWLDTAWVSSDSFVVRVDAASDSARGLLPGTARVAPMTPSGALGSPAIDVVVVPGS